MSSWDDDDFEPEVESLAPPPAPIEEALLTEVPKPQPSTKEKPKYMQKEEKSYIMEDLGRELTAVEKEAIQRRNDLQLARDLMGVNGEDNDVLEEWKDAMTKDDFEKWGKTMAIFFSTRHKATFYGDFLSKLLSELTTDLDASEIRKMSNLLKQIADDKKKTTVTKSIAGAKGGKKAKPNIKNNASKGGDNIYDDYGSGGGAGWRNDDYDDDFM